MKPSLTSSLMSLWPSPCAEEWPGEERPLDHAAESCCCCCCCCCCCWGRQEEELMEGHRMLEWGRVEYLESQTPASSWHSCVKNFSTLMISMMLSSQGMTLNVILILMRSFLLKICCSVCVGDCCCCCCGWSASSSRCCWFLHQRSSHCCRVSDPAAASSQRSMTRGSRDLRAHAACLQHCSSLTHCHQVDCVGASLRGCSWLFLDTSCAEQPLTKDHSIGLSTSASAKSSNFKIK